MRVIRWVGRALLLSTFLLVASASAAFAATSAAPPPQVIPIGWAQVISFGFGILVPFAVKLVLRYHTPLWIQGATALVLAVASAISAYLIQVGDLPTWKGLLAATVAVLAGATVSRVPVLGGLDTLLARKTPNFGFGAPKLSPANVAVIKASGARKS